MKTGRTVHDADSMRVFAALAIVLAKGADATKSAAPRSLHSDGKASKTQKCCA